MRRATPDESRRPLTLRRVTAQRAGRLPAPGAVFWWRRHIRMNTDPNPSVRHRVLLPPSLAPVERNVPASRSLGAPHPWQWRARQRRFRGLVAAFSGALALLLAVALLLQRRPRGLDRPRVAARAALTVRAPTVRAMPTSTAEMVPAAPLAAPAESALTSLAPPIVSARPVAQKIVPSESQPKLPTSGVSKLPVSPVPTSAFDAPFVPPAD
jgi:hypothetical protein